MLLTRVACIFISGSVTLVLLLLFSLVQQLKGAEACRWYFFAVFYCWFSHDVTKIQTSKLLILLIFYFHDV